MGNCAGIDWASEKHDVLIEDPAGEELLATTFVHDEDGLSALRAAMVCFDVELVAIERLGRSVVGVRRAGVGAAPKSGQGGTRPGSAPRARRHP